MSSRRALVLELAGRAAAARVVEIRAELADILETFPELAQARPGARHATNGTAGGRVVARAAGPVLEAPRRRGRRMSAAERKAVSIRMAKYWRRRKAAEAAAARASSRPTRKRRRADTPATVARKAKAAARVAALAAAALEAKP